MKRTTTVTIGLVLAAVFGLADATSLLNATSGPAPVFVNVIDGILGLLTLAGVAMAWRGRPAGVAIVIVSRLLSALSTLPAFVADIPIGVKLLAGTFTVLDVVAVYLIARGRRLEPATV